MSNSENSEIIPNAPPIIKLNSIDSFKIINPNIEDNENININEEQINLETQINDSNFLTIQTNPDIIYQTILDEIYDTIQDNNELFANTTINISKPDIKYENRKTFWYNFGKNCTQINRSIPQFKKYIEKELAVETSVNEKSNLILRGKYNLNIIGSTYKKYIKYYVQCTTCKSLNTEIIRNSSNRLDYLKCLNPKCNTCKAVVKIA
jgi:translation initiation factor 2 subunit 2